MKALRMFLVTMAFTLGSMSGGYTAIAQHGKGTKVMAARVDLTFALPTETSAKARGFSHHRVVTRYLPRTEMNAADAMMSRDMDKLDIRISVGLGDSAEAALRQANAAVKFAQHGMLVGCPTGRTLAPDVWQSKYLGGGAPRGAFTLIAHDGSTLVIVDMTYPASRDENGKAFSQPFTQADLRFAEELVIAALEEMTKHGYCSDPRILDTCAMQVHWFRRGESRCDLVAPSPPSSRLGSFLN